MIRTLARGCGRICRAVPLVTLLGGWPAAAQDGLPEGLVYLRTVDPSIAQDIRYATAGNFTGAVVPGYRAAECILTAAAANALKRVQQSLEAEKLGLRVFDCYRPKTAVAAFMRWVEAPGGGERAPAHPRVARRDLVRFGYIAAQSGHSRGDTVDLTLMHLDGGEVADASRRPGRDCTEPPARADRDRQVDMGTAFDCFDVRSHTASKAISAEAQRARQKLVDAMRAGGFRNYAREWWHFTFGAGKGPSYDVPIERPPGQR